MIHFSSYFRPPLYQHPFQQFLPKSRSKMPKRPRTALAEILDEANRDGVRLDVSDPNKDKLVIIKLLNTTTPGTGKGYGHYYMMRMIKWADEYDFTLALTPAIGMGATSRPRLLKFYKKFDFIYNKGKDRDLSHTEDMYRKPIHAKFRW